ncbi:unnamed protein product [Pleuronectes platessa]|uniref:Uncharacterized protein n=1 Tax=Pleuronectes platessa TaxID=8262 RepID=A0A9N7W3W1_PLEPL|nr:unnamed protein product [Pleuronectes platessa]
MRRTQRQGCSGAGGHRRKLANGDQGESVEISDPPAPSERILESLSLPVPHGSSLKTKPSLIRRPHRSADAVTSSLCNLILRRQRRSPSTTLTDGSGGRLLTESDSSSLLKCSKSFNSELCIVKTEPTRSLQPPLRERRRKKETVGEGLKRVRHREEERRGWRDKVGIRPSDETAAEVEEKQRMTELRQGLNERKRKMKEELYCREKRIKKWGVVRRKSSSVVGGMREFSYKKDSGEDDVYPSSMVLPGLQHPL